MTKPKISLVMIVKNEAIALPACLESVKDIVDEWIIVDTGSTDGTQTLIREWCGVVRELPFEDFVTTKNKALAFATGDYVLFMDADERLLSGHANLLEAAADGVAAIAGQIVEAPPATPSCVYYRVRMWRNDGTWRFVGPGVHEVIVGEGAIVHHVGIRVFHDHAHRTAESYTDRYALYLRLLRDALTRDPLDGRAAFYLARTLRDAGQYLAAIDAYTYYLTLNTTFVDERWQAAYDTALCWRQLGEYAHAATALNQALLIDARRAEALCLAGDMAMQSGAWETATGLYERALKLPLPENVLLFLDPRMYTTYPHDQLVLCYDHLHRYDQALTHASAVIQAQPAFDQRLVRNLTYIRTRHDLRWLFALGPTPEPVTGDMLDRQGAGGVETTYIELPKALAARGQSVMVACHCTEAHVSDDVTFIPYAELPAYAWFNPQVVVASRWFAALAETTAKRILWLQDAWFAAPPDDLWPRLDAVVVSSPWHQSYVAQRTNPAVSGKTQVIPLGIRKQHFRALAGARQPHQLIYSSNPDRGLETLIAAWPQIVTRVPDVNLVITYGWEGLRTWSTDAAWLAQQEANQQRMTTWAAANNAVFTGRLRKADLYQVMRESALCAYPNSFQETFCLTALECQAAGTPLVTSALGALTTTVNTACNVLLRGDPLSPAYRDVFAAQVSDLLLDDARRRDYSAQCQAYVMNAPCDWTDIAQSWLIAVWR